MAQNINQPILGLNRDSISTQVKPGELRYALNGVVESFDGNQVTYSNEQGNNLCIIFPSDYRLIGVKHIVELSKVIYFLTNPKTNYSQIGYSDNEECEYNILIDDRDPQSDKLNFNINHPIHKVISKVTNCEKHFYWTDNFNPRRYINLDDLPWKETKNPNNDYQPIKLTGLLDANKLLVQSNFKIPEISPIVVDNGGILKMGTYQFTIAYSNVFGETYTSYYNVTNPISIFEQKPGQFFDLPTSKSISIQIDNLDTSGIYDYFTLAVIETINNISTPKVVGTFAIGKDSFQYTYTGVEVSQVPLDMIEIFEKFPYYEIADDIFKVDNIIGWSNLKADERINYQQIWSKVKLYWETYQIPYNQNEGYSNGLNSALYRGYMRDEVYAFEGCFLLKNGRQTDSFHIPGRVAKDSDLWSVSPEDKNNNIEETNCDPSTGKFFWQVYNTATKEGFSEEYINAQDKDCYKGPYEYGEFAYWESEDKYPNNPAIWGDLVNKPIRHHKFPDSTNSTHIHDNNVSGERGFEHKIYPIGVKIDAASLQSAIDNSDLTNEQKANIVGFKILRGNRAANKSIIAKGLLNNVGKYKYEDEPERYYANYPYNDVRSDAYFANKQLQHGDYSYTGNGTFLPFVDPGRQPGYRKEWELEGFGEHSKNRFVFHSPDTHFYNPSLNNEGTHLKIEGVMSGTSYGHFTKVRDNAEYKFLTRNTYEAARGVAQAAGITIGAGTFGSPSFSVDSMLPAYSNALELFEKLAPYTNFGWTYNSYGLYNKFQSIDNSQKKISNIITSKYVREGYESINADEVLNNKNRESSVYIQTSDQYLFTHEYGAPEDNSRFTIASYEQQDTLNDFWNFFVSTGKTFSTESLSSSIIYFPVAAIQEKIYRFEVTNISSSYRPSRDAVYLQGSNNQFTVLNQNLTADLSGGTPGDPSPYIYSGYVYMESTPVDPISSNGFLTAYSGAVGYMEYTSYLELNYSDYYADPINLQLYILTLNEYLQELNSLDQVNEWLNLPRITLENSFKYTAAQLFMIEYEKYYENTSKPSLTSEKKSSISCYYGSIKRDLKNQWGRIYSYETIDTGFYHKIKDEDNNWYREYPTVFGGDIFINRFALKQKMSIFQNTTVGQPNGADVNYDEIATLGYPMFWISTKPIKFDIDIEQELNKVIEQLNPSNVWNIVKNLLTGGASGTFTVVNMLVKVFTEIYRTIGIKNINLDLKSTIGITERGVMYLYVYGIPYYFCESEVNVDNRQALNNTYGDFFPNVSTGIPDEWLQEVNVPIIHDNYYNYNQTYSKQNKENYFAHLREDWDPTKKCYTEFPNRAIWSDKSSLEENKNNWLLYRSASYFDFEKTNGELISIDNIQNNQLLVRFQNKSQIYNALTTVEVSQGPQAYLGNSRLFSGAPALDLSETDLGYAGSQNKILLRTENGHVFTDSKRGQVVLLRGNGIEDLSSKGMEKWFDEYLPFRIKDYFPEIDIDNHFNRIGLHAVYDTFYNRLIITKLDYEPIQDIEYKFNRFYNKNNQEVQLTDKNYFCNKSWTISYSFRTQSWTSWHSYRPNYYIGFNNFFQSGEQGSLYTHNIDYNKYTTYYDKEYPYILEYPFVYKTQDEILQSIKEYATAKQYTDWDTWVDKDETIYFNKAIIYNNQQCSGVRNLIPKPKNSLASYGKYPIFNSNSTDIIVTKSDNLFNYNQFWNILKDPNQSIFTTTCEWNIEDRDLNEDNLDYTRRDYRKQQIRAKDTNVRHILDNKHDTKLSSIFILTETQPSYK